MLNYISLFSGIGGLEHPTVAPMLLCEQDPACRQILEKRYPGVPISSDIRELNNPPKAEMVVGGWPCQDLSTAGMLSGIEGSRSGLFFKMLEIAQRAEAHTLVGENVPNLLRINGGRDFTKVLDAVVASGFKTVAWRTLNARAFGLAQERRRLFIVASKDEARAWSLHAKLPRIQKQKRKRAVYGFYWTGGKRSICFSDGYVPTLKIGAADNKGRAPVAIFEEGIARKLSATEYLKLQGWEGLGSLDLSPSTLLRMAGNAVPVPIGRFVMQAVSSKAPPDGLKAGFGLIQDSGILEAGMTWHIDHLNVHLCANLEDYLETPGGSPLSPQAAAGLIVRCVRAGNPMPKELFQHLLRLSEDRGGKLHPSRANSFDALDSMKSEVEAYAKNIPLVSSYKEDASNYDDE